MAKLLNEEQVQVVVAKALAKNTKEVLKSVGESVKARLAAANDIEDRATKKVVTATLKEVAADVKSIAA